MSSISVSCIREHLVDVINQVQSQHGPAYVSRRGKRMAALISTEDLDHLIEMAENAIDITEARAAPGEGGESIPWDEVKVALGL
ncbi:MAG: type II toxin-antitoxin system Phd/YefM family antitoxin [Acidimicrobiales bacterium]